jgi:ribonuclease HI
VLVEFLRERWEIFAWCPSDMPGVPRELVEHALNVDPKARPVKQPLRRFDEPKRKAIESELHRLENVGFIQEIKASTWVSNPVIVPKKNTDVQRVCVDYTSLNKHWPKDPFPLPRIDQIIDSTAGCARLSFLDAYSGYNHIKLKKEDEEKIAIITPYGVFCYQVMPFGLKNAGATYQQMMQNCLGSQIGRNIQVYIDDVVITTRKEESLISDLAETFDNLNRYKRISRATSGMPGVSKRYRSKPRKDPSNTNNGETSKTARHIETHRAHRGTKSIRRTIGRKSAPFLCTHEKMRRQIRVDRRSRYNFCTTEKVLSTPPVLVEPNEKEPLLLYIAATHQVVSTVLVVERSKEGKTHGVQRPLYFLSEVLSPTKQRYPHYQKLAYSVFTTARKLRQYFMVHPIIVVNEVPLYNILNNPAATGRISLWGIELSRLDITYEKQKTIKSQVLPDFTAEWLELQNTGPPYLSNVWTMYFDESKRVQGAGAVVVLISLQGDKLKYVLRMSFPQASNNEAEYEALLHGMKMAKACGATQLNIFGDSNLVVQQVMNRCDAISDNMTTYRNLCYYLEGTFDGFKVSHVSRASNGEADNLANIGSQCLPIPPGVFWEEIVERSIKHNKTLTIGEPGQHPTTCSRAGKPGTGSTIEPEEVMMIEETWMQPYLAYMINKALPEDTVKAKKDNTIIQGFRHVARKTIQEKHNRRPTVMRHPSRRTRHIKRYPSKSVWASP